MTATVQIQKTNITIDIDKGVHMGMLMQTVNNICEGLKEQALPKAELKINQDFSMTLTYNEKPVLEPGNPAVVKFYFDREAYESSCDIKTGGETITSVYKALVYLRTTYAKQLIEAGKILWFGNEIKAAKWAAHVINRGL